MDIIKELEKAQKYADLGKLYEARGILRKILQSDSNHEEAWLLFSQVAEKREHEIHCLKNVIRINPNNERARNRLSIIDPSLLPDGKGQIVQPEPRQSPHSVNEISEQQPVEILSCPSCHSPINENDLECKSCGALLIGDAWQSYCDRYDKMTKAERQTAIEQMSSAEDEYFFKVWLVYKKHFPSQPMAYAVGKDLSQKGNAKPITGCGWLLIIVAVLFILGLIGTLFSGNSDWGDAGAETICHQFVSDTLKSPSSAQFGDSSVTKLGEKSYSVSSYVDAENSFGARIRSYYTCNVHDGGNGTWYLDNLSIN